MKKRVMTIEVELPVLQEDCGAAYTADFLDFLKPEVAKRFVPEPAWILERYIAFSDNQARERRKLLQEKLKAIKALQGSGRRPPSPKGDLPSAPLGVCAPGDGQPVSSKVTGNDSKKANVATGARKP